MGEGNGKTIIAIIIVLVLLGAAYLWYTGGLGRTPSGGGGGYQGISTAGGGVAGGTTSSGFDFGGLGMLPLLGLGGGGLAIAGSAYSKRKWGTYNFFGIKKNVIELAANPQNLTFTNHEAGTTITAKFKRTQLLGKPVEFTIGATTGTNVQAQLFRVGETRNGQPMLEVTGAPQEETVSVDLKVRGSEDSTVQVCARVKDWGLGKKPHECITVSRGSPITGAAQQPRPTQVTTTAGETLTLELTPQGGTIETGAEVNIIAKLSPAKQGQITFRTENKKGAAATIDPQAADIDHTTGKAETKLKSGGTRGEAEVIATYTTQQNQTISAKAKFKIKKSKPNEAGAGYKLILTLPKQVMHATHCRIESGQDMPVYATLTQNNRGAEGRAISFDLAEMDKKKPPGTGITPKKKKTNNHGIAGTNFHAGEIEGDEPVRLKLLATHKVSRGILGSEPAGFDEKTIEILPPSAPTKQKGLKKRIGRVLKPYPLERIEARVAAANAAILEYEKKGYVVGEEDKTLKQIMKHLNATSQAYKDKSDYKSYLKDTEDAMDKLEEMLQPTITLCEGERLFILDNYKTSNKICVMLELLRKPLENKKIHFSITGSTKIRVHKSTIDATTDAEGKAFVTALRYEPAQKTEAATLIAEYREGKKTMATAEFSLLTVLDAEEKGIFRAFKDSLKGVFEDPLTQLEYAHIIARTLIERKKSAGLVVKDAERTLHEIGQKIKETKKEETKEEYAEEADALGECKKKLGEVAAIIRELDKIRLKVEPAYGYAAKIKETWYAVGGQDCLFPIGLSDETMIRSKPRVYLDGEEVRILQERANVISLKIPIGKNRFVFKVDGIKEEIVEVTGCTLEKLAKKEVVDLDLKLVTGDKKTIKGYGWTTETYLGKKGEEIRLVASISPEIKGYRIALTEKDLGTGKSQQREYTNDACVEDVIASGKKEYTAELLDTQGKIVKTKKIRVIESVAELTLHHLNDSPLTPGDDQVVTARLLIEGNPAKNEEISFVIDTDDYHISLKEKTNEQGEAQARFRVGSDTKKVEVTAKYYLEGTGITKEEKFDIYTGTHINSHTFLTKRSEKAFLTFSTDNKNPLDFEVKQGKQLKITAKLSKAGERLFFPTQSKPIENAEIRFSLRDDASKGCKLLNEAANTDKNGDASTTLKAGRVKDGDFALVTVIAECYYKGKEAKIRDGRTIKIVR